MVRADADPSADVARRAVDGRGTQEAARADADNFKKYGTLLDRESATNACRREIPTVGQIKERLSSFSNILRGKG